MALAATRTYFTVPFFINDLHALQVRGENTFVNLGHVPTNTTVFFRFTAAADAASHEGTLTCNCANSSHCWTPF